MKKHLLFIVSFFIIQIVVSQTTSCEYILSNSSTDAQFSAILSQIGSDDCNIRILGDITINSGNHYTIGDNINLIFEKGGYFKGAGELTINASIQAGLFQIFDMNKIDNLHGKPSTDRFFPQWFGAKINDGNSDNVAINNTIKFCNQAGGGTVFFPSGKYRLHETIIMKSNVHLEGEGDSSEIHNTQNGPTNTIDAIGTNATRIHGIGFKKLLLKGINNKGKTGINIKYSFNNEFADPWDGDGVSQRGDPIVISDVTILDHKEHGISFEDGSQLTVMNCTIENNGLFGIRVDHLSNHLEVNNCAISNNKRSGILLNWVASNCTILGTQFTRNSEFGIHLYSSEQSVISYCSFNGNKKGGIMIEGQSSKYNDSPLIIGSLFGGNGLLADNAYEINLKYTKGASILSNYFFGVENVNTKAMIYIGEEVKGCTIKGSHWKLLNNNTKKIDYANNYFSQNIIFDDDNRTDGMRQVYTRNKYTQYINDSKNNIVFQTKFKATGEYYPPNFRLKNGGEMMWSGGSQFDTGIIYKRVNSDLMSLSSNLQSKTISVKEINANEINREADYGTIFLDITDNKLKIKLPNGIIKTIKFE